MGQRRMPNRPLLRLRQVCGINPRAPDPYRWYTSVRGLKSGNALGESHSQLTEGLLEVSREVCHSANTVTYFDLGVFLMLCMVFRLTICPD